NASNTRSRGAPITREITISRSAAACASSPPLLVVAIVWSLLPCLLQLLHVLVQPVEALAPEPLEAAHPLVDRPQPAGVQAVQPLLARPTDPAPARPPGGPAGVWPPAAGSSPGPAPGRSPAARRPAAAPGSPAAAARRSR